MTTIETLPHEMLAEFLSYLPCIDLLRTARVSPKFHALSTALLYKAPRVTSISGTKVRGSREMRLRKGTPPLQILLRTLLSPGGEELAAKVRSLRVQWDNISLQPPTYVPRKWAVIFEAAASRVGLDLLMASQSAQVVLLLHLLPRLQVLHLTPPLRWDAVFNFIDRHRGPTTAEAPQLPLHQLREFCCFRATVHDQIHPGDILVLLGLANMRRIDVHIADNLLPVLPSPTRASGVTRLRLTGPALSLRSLTCILSAAVALTHFSYGVRLPEGNLDLTQITPALATLRETLQVLHVQLVGPARPRATVIGTLGTFRDWPRLRTLRCRMDALLKVPGDTELLRYVLPPGLRELEIVGNPFWRPEDEVEQVRRLVALKRIGVPALERVAMMLWRREDLVLETMLRSVCREADVVLEDQSRGGESVLWTEMWREVYVDEKPGAGLCAGLLCA